MPTIRLECRVMLIPVNLAEAVAEEAKNMELHEEFVTERDLAGDTSIGLYLMTSEEVSQKFET